MSRKSFASRVANEVLQRFIMLSKFMTYGC